MVPRVSLFLAIATLLAGCSDEPALTTRGSERALTEGGYLAPPRVTTANAAAGGLELRGMAAPASRVRLGTPDGREIVAQADARGAWTMTAPIGVEVEVFGLSMMRADRLVQGEGYVLLTPKGQAALLRAGSGAERLDARPRPFSIGAFDFDAAGASVVSGWGAPNSGVTARLDGRQTVEGRTDARGWYMIVLPNLAAGAHDIEIVGDGASARIKADITPAAALTDSPVAASPAAGSTRIDWMTPGGGMQSTLIVD